MSERDFVKTNIKQYVIVDNKIQKLEKQLRLLKKSREAHAENIKGFLSKKGKTELSSKVNNIYFKIQHKNIKQSLTQSYLATTLEKYFKTRHRQSKTQANQTAQKVLKFLNANRSITRKTTLKRLKRSN